MAWRKLTEDDLIATLSRREVDAFKRDFELDPVPTLLSDTASFVRGFIRSNGNVRMDPNNETIPASCVSPACDYVAIKLLKRINIEPSEIRKTARADAIRYFESIAKGDVNPESAFADPAATTGGSCAKVITTARPRVTAKKLEGL